MRRVRKTVAVMLCAVLLTGCASAGGSRVSPGPAATLPEQDRAVLVGYVQKLPPGTAVRVARANGRPVRGTLMKATDAAIIVQQRTRIPEPAQEILFSDIVSVTPDTGSGFSLAKAIGAGAAAGAGAALAVFIVLVAIYD